MPISELTKSAGVKLRGQNTSRLRKVRGEIMEHEQAIASLEAEEKRLSDENAALTQDIPEPTPPNPAL